jgi:hypothetical protein
MKKYLFITIDTEEDDWGDYQRSDTRTQNLQGIEKLQRIFEKYKVTPTYLINYAVLQDEYCTGYLKAHYEEGLCDIGTHCHPWNTPPKSVTQREADTFMCNMDEAIVLEKIKTIHREIENKMRLSPVAFRAGRWGFGRNVLKALKTLDYKIDTSMTPFVDWDQYGGPVFNLKSNRPFTLAHGPGDSSDVDYRYEDKEEYIVEIPPTIGYLNRDFAGAEEVLGKMRGKMVKVLKIRGLLDKTGVASKRWLSPELSNEKDMKKLTRNIVDMGNGFVNMSFHSTSLVPGFSPFVKDTAEERRFYRKIEGYIEYAAEIGLTSKPIFAAEDLLYKDQAS